MCLDSIGARQQAQPGILSAHSEEAQTAAAAQRGSHIRHVHCKGNLPFY